MKRLLLLMPFAFSLFAATPEYTDEITVTFSFKASPKTQADRDALVAQFDPFLKTARSGDQQTTNDAEVKQLLADLEKAITGFPEYCKKHEIAGSANISLNVSTVDATK
jgi:hypothetical protein